MPIDRNVKLEAIEYARGLISPGVVKVGDAWAYSAPTWPIGPESVTTLRAGCSFYSNPHVKFSSDRDYAERERKQTFAAVAVMRLQQMISCYVWSDQFEDPGDMTAEEFAMHRMQDKHIETEF